MFPLSGVLHASQCQVDICVEPFMVVSVFTDLNFGEWKHMGYLVYRVWLWDLEFNISPKCCSSRANRSENVPVWTFNDRFLRIQISGVLLAVSINVI